MVRAQTTTGLLATYFNICSPKGEMNEPLCHLRGDIRRENYEPGTLLFFEEWNEQLLGPNSIFDEMWEFNALLPGTQQWNEPWELMEFEVGSEHFLEEWEFTGYAPSSLFNEPWEANEFEVGSLQFLEQWEVVVEEHNWFFSDDFPPNGITQGFVYQGGMLSFSGATNPDSFVIGTGFSGSGSSNAKIRELEPPGELPWSLTETFSGSHATQLINFQDELWVFIETTDNDPEVYNGNTDFFNLNEDILFAGQRRIISAMVFSGNGNIYAGSSPPLITDTPKIFEREFSGSWGTAFTFPSSVLEVNSLIEFNSKIYAGTSGATVDAQLWESSDGSSWSVVHTFTGRSGLGGLEVHDGDLYASVYEEGSIREVQVSDGTDVTTWSLDNSFGIVDSESIMTGLTSDGVLLFVGVGASSGSGASDAKVYVKDEDDMWELSADFNDSDQFGGDASSENSCTAVQYDSHTGKVYACAANFGLGTPSIYVCPTADDVGGGG